MPLSGFVCLFSVGCCDRRPHQPCHRSVADAASCNMLCELQLHMTWPRSLETKNYVVLTVKAIRIEKFHLYTWKHREGKGCVAATKKFPSAAVAAL